MSQGLNIWLEGTNEYISSLKTSNTVPKSVELITTPVLEEGVKEFSSAIILTVCVGNIDICCISFLVFVNSKLTVALLLLVISCST